VRALHANLVVPHSRVFSHSAQPVQISSIDVDVHILDQAATTNFTIKLFNPSNRQQEAEMLLPIHSDAVLSSFDFAGKAKEPKTGVLPRDEAIRIYRDIVRRYKDPALMQFVGLNLIRTAVFPVEPRGNQTIKFTIEQVLGAVGNRVDYELPRSEALGYKLPWNITVEVKSTRDISTVYSPSHELCQKRHNAKFVLNELTEKARSEPGPFRLSYILGGEEVSASMFAYPDPTIGGGYFMVVAGLPTKKPADAKSVQREVTLVIDRSGSMNGEKWKQAKAAAMQVIGGLEEGEAFNLIAYNTHVDSLFTGPKLRSDETEKAARKFLEDLRPNGGTNIHDALLEALNQKPIEGKLPMVLFLTDGLATIGHTSEVRIRNLATKHNKHNRRVFTIGVGLDVNAPLLENIADTSRGTSSFVLPREDVEVKVGDVFNRLKGPVLSNPKLELPKGKAGAVRVTEMMPGLLPDLFEGDQLVLLGKYRGDAPLEFKLSGDFYGQPKTFQFKFDLSKATTRNAFVGRLWAARKVGVLVDSIRQAGAELPSVGASSAMDPKFKEVVDEIIRLSTEFGILTEYTAFLSLEGTDMSKKAEVAHRAWGNLHRRGQVDRSGAGGVNQTANGNRMKKQHVENKRNDYLDRKLNRVSVGDVQQMNDRTFFKRSGAWVDARLIDKLESLKPTKTITAGSDEYIKLANTLEKEGRQGILAMEGEILVKVGDDVIKIVPAEK
jgi:Ca-activated chloride channel family protein